MKRSQAQREAFAKLAGIPIEEMTTRPQKRVITIPRSCRTCALQMVGGQRCYAHNPLPLDDRPHIQAQLRPRDPQSGMPYATIHSGERGVAQT